MIQKKVCMVGAFAVGKTSLVSRFVNSMYSDKYLTTVGVKIDKKQVKVDDQTVNLILWDLQGEDDVQKLRMSYLRGAAGYLLVVDGTRRETLDTASAIREDLEKAFGPLPFLCLVNKVDLKDSWEVEEGALKELEARGWSLLETSAKTGAQVEEAFTALARSTLGG